LIHRPLEKGKSGGFNSLREMGKPAKNEIPVGSEMKFLLGKFHESCAKQRILLGKLYQLHHITGEGRDRHHSRQKARNGWKRTTKGRS
jgi:hypothetical protein